jgi:methyl-accepting chemotaxis protein
MSRQWTFGQKLALGFALPIVLLIALGAVSYRISDLLVENSQQVTHSYHVLESLASLESQMKDAETGQRGYLLTGRDTYLEPYNSALIGIPKRMAELRDLTSDNAHQQQRLDQAQPLVDAKLAELKQTIDLRTGQGLDAALQVVLSDRGKKAMDDLRQVLAAVDAEERDLLVQRDQQAKDTVRTAKISIWSAAITALLLAGLTGYLITRSLNTQLGNAVSGIQSSSVELQSAAAESAAGSTEQKAAITEASTTLKELAATSRQMAENAQRVTRIAEDNTTSARNGDLTVQRAQEAIGGIRRQVDLIVAHMLDLGKKSQQVGVVLELINELAEQTNILAVNATIESAGAGEAGKRFGVVADEIRKLADRVGSSSKEIRTLIEEIRSAANTTVMATEDGSKAVDAGTRQFGDVAQVFRQIAGGVQTTTDASREIELGSRQQVTAIDQVSTALQGILQAATQAESSTRQTQETSTQLALLARQLLQLVRSEAAA